MRNALGESDTLSFEVTMKPTMLNINKAKSLLRAMADVSTFEIGAAVDPVQASGGVGFCARH